MNFKKSILSFLAFSALTAFSFSGTAAAAAEDEKHPIGVSPDTYQNVLSVYWSESLKVEPSTKLKLYTFSKKFVGVAEVYDVDGVHGKAAPIFLTCGLQDIDCAAVSEVLNNPITKEIAESQKIKNWNAPSSGPIVRGFGLSKSQFEGEKFFSGVQYEAHGQPIYAVADGEVIHASTDSHMFGSLIVLQHFNDKNEKEELWTEYGGIITPAKPLVTYENRTKFKAGELIGYAAQKGRVFFGVYSDGEYRNPVNYLK